MPHWKTEILDPAPVHRHLTARYWGGPRMNENTTAVVLGSITFLGLASWGLLARLLARLASRAWVPSPESALGSARLTLVPPPSPGRAWEAPQGRSGRTSPGGGPAGVRELSVGGLPHDLEQERAVLAARQIRRPCPAAGPRGNGVLLSELLGEESEP